MRRIAEERKCASSCLDNLGAPGLVSRLHTRFVLGGGRTDSLHDFQNVLIAAIVATFVYTKYSYLENDSFGSSFHAAWTLSHSA